MRILTVISGILLAAIGAFCFAFASMPFAGLAFPIGITMIISAALTFAAYISNAKEGKASDTMLVEGIVSFLFGFCVVTGQTQDSMVGVFFGAWLCICGGNRISQSLAVSRHSPKDWYKILPLSIIDVILGAVMMMPTLSSGVSSMMLIAISFVINGLSLLVYAMYMQAPENIKAQQDALARAEAKKQAAEEKRRERNRLRNLSYEERVAEEDRIKQEKKTSKLEKREAKRLEREALKEAKRTELSHTLELGGDDIKEIARAAEASGLARAQEEALAKERAASRQDADSLAEDEKSEPELYPTFKKPTDIPTLRAQKSDVQLHEPEPEIDEVEISAVNLAEIENAKPVVEFEKVELPDVETQAEGGESAKRADILRWLGEKSKARKETRPGYTPLSLDELIPEQMPSRRTDDDDDRFSKTLTFKWSEADLAKIEGRK